MAFKKKITARGAEGNYLRLVAFRWDERAREASAIFSLYVDVAHAEAAKASAATAATAPLVEVAAKLRLSGAEFDRYVGKRASANGDLVAGLYRAARDASTRARDGADESGTVIVSDYGRDLFAAAEDV